MEKHVDLCVCVCESEQGVPLVSGGPPRPSEDCILNAAEEALMSGGQGAGVPAGPSHPSATIPQLQSQRAINQPRCGPLCCTFTLSCPPPPTPHPVRGRQQQGRVFNYSALSRHDQEHCTHAWTQQCSVFYYRVRAGSPSRESEPEPLKPNSLSEES